MPKTLNPALQPLEITEGMEFEVWGIGPQYRRLLQTHGIGNAFQLSRADERWARQRLTVMGLRTVLELRGVACFGLEELPPPKKAIARARQFGRRIRRPVIGSSQARIILCCPT